MKLPADYFCLPCRWVELLPDDKSRCTKGMHTRPQALRDCPKYWPLGVPYP